MADLHGFVTKIITSVSGLLEEGKVGICKEKMSLLQRVDGEILGGLKEEQEI